MTDSATYLSQLHERLDLTFNEEELRGLCLDLNVDFDNLAGKTKKARFNSLLLGLGRNGRLAELVTLAQQKRPHVEWLPVLDDFELPESLSGVETAVPANQYHVYGDFVDGDKISGDKVVGDKIVYHGLSTEEVADLAIRLKHKDQPKVWDGRTPYLGLSAFQESDAHFFFGRERLVTELLERVKIARFIVIAGPSGSGKSSVARAGLFHALRQGRLPKSDNWLLATMQPKGNPFLELATAIDRMVGKPNAGDYLRENGRSNLLAFHEQIEPLLSVDPQQRCVILVDQFEETFTQTQTEDCAPFIDLLTEAARVENGRVTIILSIRADFVSHCARYRELRALVSQQFQLVGAMDPPDLAKAITLPALEVGAKIDPALVSRMMADMKGEPGALPLMSFALRDLFEAKKPAKGEPMDLTLPEYLRRGGIESALERHANKVFEQFNNEQKALARGIFSKLIEVGQGRADTRRTAVFHELIPAGTTQDAVETVVHTLTQEGVRLITTDGEANQRTITLAHEKLLDAWPWLRQLVNENREMIILQNQVNDDAAAWAKEKDTGYLYRGGRLIQVEERLEALTPSLDTLSQKFIQASRDERQKEIEAKKAQQQWYEIFNEWSEFRNHLDEILNVSSQFFSQVERLTVSGKSVDTLDILRISWKPVNRRIGRFLMWSGQDVKHIDKTNATVELARQFDVMNALLSEKPSFAETKSASRIWSHFVGLFNNQSSLDSLSWGQWLINLREQTRHFDMVLRDQIFVADKNLRKVASELQHFQRNIMR